MTFSESMTATHNVVRHNPVRFPPALTNPASDKKVKQAQATARVMWEDTLKVVGATFDQSHRAYSVQKGIDHLAANGVGNPVREVIKQGLAEWFRVPADKLHI